ncbi:hypothetical protein CLAFUW4_02188 [Fulvia fulva]|uniref:Glycosyltransferase family 31 protein n=1 Tax=Passalora fulva TaxID=5499 RepID=A0A9Q8L6F3_PASFU|nr:uncharacterized protein CLAFUR5_02180 [Fulvia fulva]KAK4635886.1 hypothetical protein CLAFUR4_02183 [Fulvia fulva]KAK4638604.1 hypothetical protein CLAFUR0_02186 [Fulvia fulva]UJO11667.1 hypothetical protein CLAFUR5_02180 [Fulvia fulva]WPV10295.1 hypothetical protein CLAFUW4_02188 [Fulvia fulva]WPV24654.1 hypothetical protein CLAFUW7_02188 [Fulvia fulva]
MPPVRIIQVLVAAALVSTCAYFLLVPSWPSATRVSQWQKTVLPGETPKNITLDVEVLKILDVPATFTYSRHCLVAREQAGLSRQSLIQINDALFAPSRTTHITLDEDFVPDPENNSLFPHCESATLVDVPEFWVTHASPDTSALMLGVATTLKRIRESLPTFSRWLSNTGSPLVVLLVDQKNLEDGKERIEVVKTEAQALNIELILEPYHNTFSHDSEGLKNFGLATVLHKRRRPTTQWFGIIDDDTFFLSLPRMMEALGPYDPVKPWYIGSLTEGHTRVAQEGFKAWGGAGFFISPPLMKTLAEHATDCTPLDKFFGDILWRDCILEVTSPTVHLTELRGLNQMDLWNDLSGWYEAGFSPILTVHHWKSWHFFPIATAHVVTDVAGPDSLLQRYQFGNNTIFTNGYSIVGYPYGLPDLNLVELTMTEDVNVKRPPEKLEFHHSMGNTRPALEVGKEKISWEFAHAVKIGDGLVRQFYVKRQEDDVSVVEIDWTSA